ncbi:MAG: hypothetical protein ACRCSG_07630 [Cellulosilyticaceae bacterium]
MIQSPKMFKPDNKSRKCSEDTFLKSDVNFVSSSYKPSYFSELQANTMSALENWGTPAQKHPQKQFNNFHPEHDCCNRPRPYVDPCCDRPRPYVDPCCDRPRPYVDPCCDRPTPYNDSCSDCCPRPRPYPRPYPRPCPCPCPCPCPEEEPENYYSGPGHCLAPSCNYDPNILRLLRRYMGKEVILTVRNKRFCVLLCEICDGFVKAFSLYSQETVFFNIRKICDVELCY